MKFFKTQYNWNGEPILDIIEWTKNRKEKMIKLRFRRKSPNIFSGTMNEEIWEEEMPESFWNCFRFDAQTGIPEKIGEYYP